MSSIRSTALFAVCLTALCAQQASAQQPAATPAAIDVPASTCKDPGVTPLDKSGPEMGRFQKRFDVYKDCVQAYVKANQAKAGDLEAQSRAYADAANKTIDEYNAYVTALNGAIKTNK